MPARPGRITSVLSHLPPQLKGALRRASSIVGSVDSVRTFAPDIVLTFDDGPDPVGTESVLAALSAHGATATFFVLLSRVRRFPQLLAEVRDAGHEIALHGVDHQPLTTFRYSAAKSRTASALAELEDRLGEPVRWFRPPYGRQTLATWRAVTAVGLTPVLWGPTTWDWRDVAQEDRVWKSQQGAVRGAIVLAHDAFAAAADGAPDVEAPPVDRGDLVGRALEGYAGRGLRACSLREALTRGTPVLSGRFRR